MSNFDTLTPTVAGVPGLAPVIFSACTPDSLVTITTVGYLNDLAALGQVKFNDVMYVNYLATTLAASVLAVFRVTVAGANTSLVAFP